MNVVILRGVVSRDAARRALATGHTVVEFDVTTTPVSGPAATVPVVWPDGPDEALVAAGTEVIVTGVVRRRFFRSGGVTASRTEVVADAVVPAAHRRKAARQVARALAGTGLPEPSNAAP
jgi:single-strand DNA-binding protein